MLESALISPPVEGLDTGAAIWLEALPARTYETKQYGSVPVTSEKLERMVQNFKSGVRGQEIATDFDHGQDKAKGNKASGWYKDFKVAPSSSDDGSLSLWAQVEFTEEAEKELKDGAWKYFSLEWDDEWTDNSGAIHSDVVIGGALTNRPIAKRIMPINFSEAMWDDVDDDTKKAFAVWSTAFVNDLPDSCFLYIEPGGKKDSEGKTTPRSLRHLPYKDSSGKIDLPHLRNAIARIPQMKGIGADLKARLQARARRLLGGKSKSMAESEEVRDAYELLVEAGFEVLDESKEWEHSEPGTGNPPQPRTDEDGSDDPAIKTGSRRESPPITKELEGGSVLTSEQLEELYKLTGVERSDDNAELVTAIKNKFAEQLTPEQKKFSEDYPAQWAEMQRLTNLENERAGKAFSESVSTIKRQEGDSLRDTEFGLSALAKEKVAEVHKKFAEGTVGLNDFEEAIKAITESGVVRFGEEGSTQEAESVVIDISSAQGIQGARRLFAEKVREVQASTEGMDYSAALVEASKKFPELAQAYRAAAPA
jgi:Mu-like prophage I protein